MNPSPSPREIEFVSADDDRWPVAADGEASIPGADRLFSWPQWLSMREAWPRDLPASILIANDLDVRELLPHLSQLARIALHFPKWTDGRAYSQARLLRIRHRFAGELRAVGDVIPDMAAQLQRTGFSAAVLRAGESVEVARRMLALIPAFYQADASEPRQRFARVAADAVAT